MAFCEICYHVDVRCPRSSGDRARPSPEAEAQVRFLLGAHLNTVQQDNECFNELYINRKKSPHIAGLFNLHGLRDYAISSLVMDATKQLNNYHWQQILGQRFPFMPSNNDAV